MLARNTSKGALCAWHRSQVEQKNARFTYSACKERIYWRELNDRSSFTNATDTALLRVVMAAVEGM